LGKWILHLVMLTFLLLNLYAVYCVSWSAIAGTSALCCDTEATSWWDLSLHWSRQAGKLMEFNHLCEWSCPPPLLRLSTMVTKRLSQILLSLLWMMMMMMMMIRRRTITVAAFVKSNWVQRCVDNDSAIDLIEVTRFYNLVSVRYFSFLCHLSLRQFCLLSLVALTLLFQWLVW